MPTSAVETHSLGLRRAVDLAFRRAFDYRGRSSRAEFWWFYLFNWLVVVIGYAAIAVFDMIYRNAGFLVFLAVLGWLAVAFVLTLSLAVRRLHDMDRSGWFIALAFIPVVNLGLLIWLAFPGTSTANRFGPPPRQATYGVPPNSGRATERNAPGAERHPTSQSASPATRNFPELNGRGSRAPGSVFIVERTEGGMRLGSCVSECGGNPDHMCALSDEESLEVAQAVWVAAGDDPGAVWTCSAGVEVSRRNPGGFPAVVAVSWQSRAISSDPDHDSQGWRCSAMVLEGDPRDGSNSSGTFIEALRWGRARS